MKQMKMLGMCLCVCFLFAGIVSASTLDATGLVSLYEFDDGANLGANSAGGQTGTATAITQDTAMMKIGSGAGSFFTSTSELIMSALDRTDLTLGGTNKERALSVSIWFKTTVNPADPTRIMTLFSAGEYNSTNRGWIEALYRSGGGNPLVRGDVVEHVFPTVNQKVVDDYTSMHDGTWHHYVLTMSTGTTKTLDLYLDGSLVATNTITFDKYGIDFASVVIGNTNEVETSNNVFEGYLDDVSVWSRELSAEDVSTIYNGGQAGQGVADLVPEPTTMTLVTVGLAMTAVRRRKA